ncbi:MAG: shikimate kinase [Lautropia sp.]
MANETAGKPEDEREYLVEVGRRVRQCRRSVSLTRRQLAERSGLSERYLAQLEAGEGNISILLIRRVARVLRVDLQRLVAEPAEQLSARPTRVAVLAAHRHDGRDAARAIGGLLAERLSVPFVRVEDELRNDFGETFDHALARYGRDYCRDAERKALLRLTASHRRCVLALGDLPVASSELLQMLHERCVTVWLRAETDEHSGFAAADHWVTLENGSYEQPLACILGQVRAGFASDPHYRTRHTDRAEVVGSRALDHA